MIVNKTLEQANVPECDWEYCHITEDGTIFTPLRGENDAVLETGGQVYEKWRFRGTDDRRDERYREVAEACQTAIYSGVEVETSAGVERYGLTLEDQKNLLARTDAVLAGQKRVLYHADGTLCRWYTAAEITAIAAAATRHITYHTTLCNHVNQWIGRCDSETELNAVRYDPAALPSDLAEHFAGLMEESGSE